MILHKSKPFLLISLFLTGCVSPSLQSDGPKSALYQAISTSNLFAGTSDAIKIAAVDAEFAALSRGPTGLPVNWQSGKSHQGSVTPGQNFKVGTATCRRYVRTLNANGGIQKESSTACLEIDGIWTPLN